MSPALESALIQYVAVPALGAIGLILTVCLHRLAGYLKEKKVAAKSKSLESFMFSAGEILANCAGDAVTVIEDTVRPELGKAAADGKLTPEEMKHLRELAIARAMEQAKLMGPKILENAGFTGNVLHDALGHLVDVAAAKLAGNSREVLTSAPAASPEARADSGANAGP